MLLDNFAAQYSTPAHTIDRSRLAYRVDRGYTPAGGLAPAAVGATTGSDLEPKGAAFGTLGTCAASTPAAAAARRLSEGTLDLDALTADCNLMQYGSVVGYEVDVLYIYYGATSPEAREAVEAAVTTGPVQDVAEEQILSDGGDTCQPCSAFKAGTTPGFVFSQETTTEGFQSPPPPSPPPALSPPTAPEGEGDMLPIIIGASAAAGLLVVAGTVVGILFGTGVLGGKKAPAAGGAPAPAKPPPPPPPRAAREPRASRGASGIARGTQTVASSSPHAAHRRGLARCAFRVAGRARRRGPTLSCSARTRRRQCGVWLERKTCVIRPFELCYIHARDALSAALFSV